MRAAASLDKQPKFSSLRDLIRKQQRSTVIRQLAYIPPRPEWTAFPPKIKKPYNHFKWWLTTAESSVHSHPPAHISRTRSLPGWLGHKPIPSRCFLHLAVRVTNKMWIKFNSSTANEQMSLCLTSAMPKEGLDTALGAWAGDKVLIKGWTP